MNDQFGLNSEAVRVWLGQQDRKRTYLSRTLCVSDNLVDKMLAGHVPKARTLAALAQLMGVTEQQLLIPKAKAG